MVPGAEPQEASAAKTTRKRSKGKSKANESDSTDAAPSNGSLAEANGHNRDSTHEGPDPEQIVSTMNVASDIPSGTLQNQFNHLTSSGSLGFASVQSSAFFQQCVKGHKNFKLDMQGYRGWRAMTDLAHADQILSST